MSLIFDPSMLMTPRVATWIERVHRDAPDQLPLAPGSALAAAGRIGHPGVATYCRGRFRTGNAIIPEAYRLPGWYQPAVTRYVESPVLAEVIGALEAGHALVARWPVTFDELLNVGYSLKVFGGREAERAWLWVDQSLLQNHLEALQRRVRYIARLPAAVEYDPVVEVADFGPYHLGNWR